MGTSLRSVARAAGVSTATVSRVINRHPQVSEQTRDKVQAAMDRVGYRPRIQQSPVRGQLLTVIVPDVVSPFFNQVLSGIEEEAFAHAVNPVVYTIDGRSEVEVLQHIDALNGDLMAGLILVTPSLGDDDRLRELGKRLPIVVVDYHSEHSDFPHVSVDNLRAGYAATRHLIERGHRKIGILEGPPVYQSAMDRLLGFRLALDEAGLPLEPEWIRQGDFGASKGYEATLEILKLGKSQPTALFCTNDLTAAGSLRALHEQGVAVPGEMAIMGFDDLPIAELVAPLLTTMAQPMKEMGETAARMLLRLVAGERLETGRIVLEATLVERQSA